MDIIRFSPNEMHLLVTFSALKGRNGVEWVLKKYKKSTIDPLRAEARAMIYLLAGLSEAEARKKSGCEGRDHDRLWAALMCVYRELEPMAEARRRADGAQKMSLTGSRGSRPLILTD